MSHPSEVAWIFVPLIFLLSSLLALVLPQPAAQSPHLAAAAGQPTMAAMIVAEELLTQQVVTSGDVKQPVPQLTQ